MKRAQKWFGNVGVVLALAAGLAAWIALPWAGVLALAGLVALWLPLTRSGRLALAAAKIGIAGLPQRWGASSVIVIGIAGVVGVLVAMLAMGEGFKATLDRTGSDTTAIILRGGSQAETNSVIARDQVPLISALPGIARGKDGRPLVSPELSQVVNLPSKADGTDANVQFRGVGPAAWELRPDLELLQGRRFNPGLRELVVGKGAQAQFAGLEVGRQLELANQQWTVVGMFASGDAHESELWADADVLGPAYQRSAFQSVTVKLAGKAGFKQLKAALAGDPRLKLDVLTTHDYYAKQSEGLSKLIRILGTVIGTIMAIGAVFGALNTMYAAVAGRAREIATMRALGFRGLPVVVSVMLETMLLALAGGVLGAAVAWLVFNGYTVSTLGSNFSQVVFQFRVGPELLWTGLKWALGIGLVGGLFPALRAARLPVTVALRGA
ncbi:ABC transporter permease [Cognatiluteimonas weifangensis]|uniref:ABC transporter permease n=1 Tax=Cognatiluteimonas weifangensis TaxID=2303539 RepID=A0A372DI20_9GAMM|nr:ABC transporter permease [Luteimonas weifangensis]RFP59176.1 ABC transporter permease [Luteimonas weifangensis]